RIRRERGSGAILPLVRTHRLGLRRSDGDRGAARRGIGWKACPVDEAGRIEVGHRCDRLRHRDCLLGAGLIPLLTFLVAAGIVASVHSHRACASTVSTTEGRYSPARPWRKRAAGRPRATAEKVLSSRFKIKSGMPRSSARCTTMDGRLVEPEVPTTIASAARSIAASVL